MRHWAEMFSCRSENWPNWTRFPCNYFTGGDWHFWGSGFIWSPNIRLNRSVSWQNVLALTSVFPHSAASYVKTSLQYIWQCVSSLNLTGFIFSFPHLFPRSLFCAFLLHFFSFFSPFPGVPLSRPRTQLFPRVCCWRLSHCFLLQGNREGGRQASWLPGCQFGVYVSVRKSRGDRSDDDRGSVYKGTDFG